MHTVSIVLNIDADRSAEFERAFAEHEVPIWKDLHGRGTLLRASLSPLDITTVQPEDVRVKQYLVIAQFKDFSGHHEHDDDHRSKRGTRWPTRTSPKTRMFSGATLSTR